jgi:enamine deaminase RidA (YjgF/YER057c/UK114 family)
MTIERFGKTAYGDGRIVHTPVVRAGNWIFATGLRANRSDGLMEPAVLKRGRPLDAPPKAEREATFIFEQLKAQLAQAGGSLSGVARLDQYYRDALSVDPYHVARKRALAGQVAPSTSIIVSELLNLDAEMDVQVMAPTEASGYKLERAARPNLNAPQTSGYAPYLRVGDFVFIAGQLARDDSGDIAPEAKLPPGQLWNGTRIKRETEYLIEKRLRPGLASGGSSLDLVLKAQVYLSRVEDFPAFWQSWSQAFGGVVPPTTVVPVLPPAFGSRDATIEVNVIAAHESARGKVRDVPCEVSLVGDGMIPGRVCDGILFVAGLTAVDEDGLVASAGINETVPFYSDSARAQLADILTKAQKIFQAAGTDLSNVVRALQFHSDLRTFYGAHGEWTRFIGDMGLPFSAVQVAPDLFVPGASLIVDLWGYVPTVP